MILLNSKEASWDRKLNSYVLNFRGRANQVRWNTGKHSLEWKLGWIYRKTLSYSIITLDFKLYQIYVRSIVNFCVSVQQQWMWVQNWNQILSSHYNLKRWHLTKFTQKFINQKHGVFVFVKFKKQPNYYNAEKEKRNKTYDFSTKIKLSAKFRKLPKSFMLLQISIVIVIDCN